MYFSYFPFSFLHTSVDTVAHRLRYDHFKDPGLQYQQLFQS